MMRQKAIIEFLIPELSETVTMNQKLNATEGAVGHCDMLTGRDLVNQMGPDTCGDDPGTKWPSMNAEMALKPSGIGKQEAHFIQDPDCPLQGKNQWFVKNNGN